MSRSRVPADRNRAQPSHLRQSHRPKSAIGPDSLELKASRINSVQLPRGKTTPAHAAWVLGLVILAL
jgi:hypothetical protein